jgi:hypothetical protein
MQPILLDLFCGRGGWSQAFHREGWRCIGIDRENHGYPFELHLATLPQDDESVQMFMPNWIVASPPCEEFARHHLPWIAGPAPDTSLLLWSVSLASRLATPMTVECSRFASWHVPGGTRCGSYYLWGNLPALLPTPPRRKSKMCGEDPAARAMIEPTLAEWIASYATARVREQQKISGGR